jgi:alpha-tubulin suppressor-like RCC1 family protein
VVAVSAGASHSLALRADGTVVAWGLNDHGQLGDGTTLSRSAPVQVLGVGGTGVLNSVVAVWAGASHSVALRSDGSVVAWGYNADGELGNNATADGLSPVQVQGSTGSGALTGVLSLSAGGSHTVALRSDGRVLSWGLNTDGQLGNNSTASSGTPARVRAVGGAGFLINVASVAAGGCHSLALLKDGTANCWGANGSGQLGNGAAVSQSTPV